MSGQSICQRWTEAALFQWLEWMLFSDTYICFIIIWEWFRLEIIVKVLQQKHFLFWFSYFSILQVLAAIAACVEYIYPQNCVVFYCVIQMSDKLSLHVGWRFVSEGLLLRSSVIEREDTTEEKTCRRGSFPFSLHVGEIDIAIGQRSRMKGKTS